MNLNLLVNKINILFFFTLAFFLVVFLLYLEYEKKQFIEKIDENYEGIARYIENSNESVYDIVEYIESQNFEITHGYNDRRASQRMIRDAEFISVGFGYEHLKFKGERLFHYHSYRFDFMFRDLNKYEKDRKILFVAITALALTILVFMWILSSLRPLTKLRYEIQKFAKGDLEIDCSSDKNDEIAQISNEFDHAVKEIRLLLESRQLFLRTVMHELKTPIAKGRIVSELIEDEKQKDRVSLVFDKLNFIVNDFAKIEQIVSKNVDIKKYNYYVKEVIDRGIEMLMIENPQDKIMIESLPEKKVNIDIDLCAMAVKNLLDNGLKYSSDKKVIIKSENDNLCFISKGDPLKRPLEEYFQPFHRDTKAKNHGMGLGLYIVKSILEIHNLSLKYEYQNGFNRFKIVEN